MVRLGSLQSANAKGEVGRRTCKRRRNNGREKEGPRQGRAPWQGCSCTVHPPDHGMPRPRISQSRPTWLRMAWETACSSHWMSRRRGPSCAEGKRSTLSSVDCKRWQRIASLCKVARCTEKIRLLSASSSPVAVSGNQSNGGGGISKGRRARMGRWRCACHDRGRHQSRSSSPQGQPLHQRPHKYRSHPLHQYRAMFVQQCPWHSLIDQHLGKPSAARASPIAWVG